MNTTLPTIAQHAKQYNIYPIKRYGQNFLYDATLCERIVRSNGDIKDKYVVEIGPGIGGLTRAILAQSPKRLIAIEKDDRCIELLSDIQKCYSNLEVILGDALELDIAALSAKYGSKLIIISNLPYEISTVLITKWLDSGEYIKSMTLMVQKEVAERICSEPHKKSYGRLSVTAQLLSDVKKCFDVSPKAFYPPPKIWSSIVYFKPHEQNLALKIRQKLDLIVSSAFSMRRKMLKSSLNPVIQDLENILSSVGISIESRAENITPHEYLKLATSIASIEQ